MEVQGRGGSLGSRELVTGLLAVAVLVSAVLLLSLDSHLTFLADDWMLLVKRQGVNPNYFLHPFHGSVVAGPAVVYKLLREIFGIGSAFPYYLAAITTFLLSVVLLFVYLRRRVGDWLALCGAVLIAFLGAAFEDLLFAFQIGYFGGVATGLGMLLALDREDDRGDRIACLLLAASLAFSSLGLAFAAAALADLLTGRRPRGLRAYVVMAPVLLYGLWWLGWGHQANQNLSWDNLLATPKFVFDAAAAGIVSLLGLATGDGSEPEQTHLIWGKLALIVALIALVVLIYRQRRISRGLAVALAAGLAFWALAGLNRDITRLPTSSRFQYPSAVFLLLIAAEILRGWRPPKLAVAAAVVITGLSLWGGLSLMHQEYRERWKPASESLRAALGAVEIAGDRADPNFVVFFPPDIRVPASTYLNTVEDYGSPAYGEATLLRRPPSERAGADLTIAQAEGLALLAPRPGSRTIACQPLRASAAGPTGLTLLHGGFTLSNRGSVAVEVLLNRFADEPSVTLGLLEPGATTSLKIPGDASERPWLLALRGEGPVRLCTTEPG